MPTNKIFLSFMLFMMAILMMSQDAYAQRERTHSRGSGANLCSTEDPRVIFKLKTAKTKYYKNYSALTINQIHNNDGRGTILGLAGGPIEIAMRGEYEIRTRKNKSCVQLSKIEVVFWAKPVVVIASNFQKGSCEYRAVLEHEQKHIRTTRKFIREFAPKMRKEVRKIIDTSRLHNVVSAEKVEQAQDQIQEPIVKRIFAYQNKIMPILRSRQEAIDSPGTMNGDTINIAAGTSGQGPGGQISILAGNTSGSGTSGSVVIAAGDDSTFGGTTFTGGVFVSSGMTGTR